MKLKTSSLIRSIPESTDEFGRAIDSNFSKWIKGTFGDRSYAIYPNVYQNSDNFRDFRYDLFKQLSDITPGDYEWSTSTGLLGEMGQAASHILLPFNDNTKLRSDFKLRKIDDDDRRMCRRLIKLVINNASWDSFSVKDKSSSGFPYFIKGVGYKLSTVEKVFKKIDKVFRACQRKDIDLVKSLIGYYPIFTLGVRYQLDKIKYEKGRSRTIKERVAFSPEYIKTNGEKGFSTVITYDVYSSNGLPDPRFCAARVRSMYALSYDYNCVLQALNNYLMNGLKKVAPEINFSTANDALNFLNRYGAKEKHAIDYGNYGETIPGEFVDIICEELEFKISGLGEFLRMTYNAPKLIRGWEKNKNEIFFSDDYVEYFGAVTASLASGHGLVAFLGKFNAVLDAVMIYSKLITKFNLEHHLRNEYSNYTRLTSSDDGITTFNDNSLKKDYLENVSSLSLFKCEVTESPTYLGSVYLESRVTRDIARLLEHLTNFERGMNSKMFFELGIGCSIREYMSNSYYNKVMPILQQNFKEIGIDLEYYISKSDEIPEPTAIFLSNPDSIFYKLDPKKVNSGIYKRYFATISQESVKKTLGALECA